MAHDVFISHSEKDKATADAVCAMLESNGIRCWIAPRDVLPSMEWGEAIIDAIEQCRIMVLVFTANANDSPQIRREVERAVNRGVAILPLRMEDVLPGKSLEYFIGNVHWLDALTPPFEAHLKNLAGTIKIVLARTEPGASLTLPKEEKPPSSSAHRAEEGTPEKGGGREGATAPRHFWSARAWTWAAGTVAAFLLVAVFVGVHFTSHPAPVVSPGAVPPPAQSNPSTAGPGGAAPVTPAPSKSAKPVAPPAAAPNPASTPPHAGIPAGPAPIPKTGPTQTASPVKPGPSVAAIPGGASPGAAADNATLLRDTMKTLQDELSSIGTVSFSAFSRSKIDGRTFYATIVERVSNVVADPTQCRVSYNSKEWANGQGQPTVDQDHWFPLQEVTSVIVEPGIQSLNRGTPPFVVMSVSPPIKSVSVLRNKSYDEFDFTDATLAVRTFETLTQAVKLCGGHLAN